MTTHLVWFRNDLRITDNPALYAACQNAEARVIAVFIATPKQWASHDMAPRQSAFIWQNLLLLQNTLADKGIVLFYHQCDDFMASVDWLHHFCQQQQVKALFYNRQYELNERQRDQSLEHLLKAHCRCYAFDDSVLVPPGTVLNGNGETYKVYTPFRRALVACLVKNDLSPLPAPGARRGERIILHQLSPFAYPMKALDEQWFPVGEEAAYQRLRRFCRTQVAEYRGLRDCPSKQATSVLSPYLTIGVISVRQCLHCLLAQYPHFLLEQESGAFSWFNEIIWREFYRHILAAYPDLCRHRPFIPWTQEIRWHNDMAHFQAWQQGLTGYPLVDAAMRQLNQIGWMHNRLRMVVASFLVKDLLIDWRMGERYFMSQLIDGDWAANNGGWQWAASCGTDAVPYFRIFNPTTQGERFDPEGDFIRSWLPELAAIPKRNIHHPQRWGISHQQGVNYPPPLIDHAKARRQTLMVFEEAKRLAGMKVDPV